MKGGSNRQVLGLGLLALAALLLALWLSFSRGPAAQAPPPFEPPAERAQAPVAPPRPALPPPAPARLGPAPPLPVRAAAGPPAPQGPDGGDPALFGPLVRLGQGFALGELLSKNAAHAEAWVDRFCEQSRRLAAQGPPRPQRPRTRDAAAFFAPLIDYEKPLDQPFGRLHLPDELRQRVGGYGADWPTRITDQDLAGLDFGWMAQLSAFDHWSLLGAGRLHERPADDFFRDPIPNYVGLQAWAKLRYAAALRRGDLAAASAEVRQLAELVRSQGILIAEMIGITILRFDAQARLRFLQAGQDVGGMPPNDLEAIDRERTLVRASMYFTYPGVSPATLRKAVECMPSPCGALVEGLGANRGFGAYGATDNLALVQELAQARGCEPALLARVVGTREQPPSEVLEVLADELDTQIPTKLAGLR